MKEYTWHKKPCTILVRPTYKPGTIRNALIEVEGTRIVVPFRAIRLVKA